MAEAVVVAEKIDLILKQNSEILERIKSIENANVLINNRLRKVEDVVETMTQDIDGVIASQTQINTDFENHKNTLNTNKKRIDNLLSKDADRLRDQKNNTKKINDLQKDLEKARQEMNDLEQYGRRAMVDIKGIPRKETENTNNIVLEIAKLMGTPLTDDDIDISHRTSNKAEAGIIVKFSSRKARDTFWGGRKSLYNKSIKDLGYVEAGVDKSKHKIYINESLTQNNGAILKETRKKLGKDKLNYKYIWTKFGITYAKKEDKPECKKISIRSLRDLNDITN